MKNFSLSISFQNILVRMKSNKAIFLIGFWIIIMLVGTWKIVVNLQIAFRSNNLLDIIPPSKGVRLQIDEYEKAVERIEKGKKYFPSEPIFLNPFR